jgi:hypothetical protein
MSHVYFFYVVIWIRLGLSYIFVRSLVQVKLLSYVSIESFISCETIFFIIFRYFKYCFVVG